MAYVQLHGADRDRKEQVMLINDVIIDLHGYTVDTIQTNTTHTN